MIFDYKDYNDDDLADAVSNYIDKEIQSYHYQGEKQKRDRKRKLYNSYGKLLIHKNLASICYDQINAELRNLSSKEILYYCRFIIYALEAELIADHKLQRLLKFKHRFTTSGVTFRDFDYLMTSKIYDTYTSKMDTGDEKLAEEVFFANCDDITYADNEIKSLTSEWIEHIKLNDYSVGTRAQQISDVRYVSRILFQKNGISKLERSSLYAAQRYKYQFSYLRFINLYHILPSDITYLIELLSQVAISTKKINEMCLCDNIYQYFFVESKIKHEKTIYRSDIPYGCQLYGDMIFYLEQAPYRSVSHRMFVSKFYSSMGEYSVTDTIDLTLESYVESYRFFRENYHDKSYSKYLFAFYNFLYDKYQIDFFARNGIDIAVLSKRDFLHRIDKGYSVVRYNPSDPIPSCDKWMLYYSKKYDSSVAHPIGTTIAVDFSDVQNIRFRAWLKEYMWHADKSILSKRKVIAELKEPLNYIHSIRMRETLVLFCPTVAKNDSPITQNEIMAYKQFVKNQKLSAVTINTRIYNLRAFLQFLSDNSICHVERGIFYHLYNQNELNNTAHAIPDTELRTLVNIIHNNATDSIKNALYAVIFTIALDTEFRISEIISLEKDCIFETAKHGEFVIRLKRKDASSEYVQEAITLETKRQIEHAIEITSNLRQEAPIYLQNTLFIVPQKGSVSIRAITKENFRKYLAECCDLAGIPRYSASNLRDTHMTKVRQFKIRNSLSEIEASVLSGHKSPNVDIQHYVDMDISTMMEAVHGIIIGNVNTLGQIEKSIPSSLETKENEVSNGCGYCNSPVCDNSTYLDCFMCRNFVTMPSKLPYFIDEIKKIDEKIKCASTPHDREDCVNIKRLLVAYVCKIKKLSEEG